MTWHLLAAAQEGSTPQLAISILVDAFPVAKAAPVSYATFLTCYVAMQCQLPLASRAQKEARVL